jgi:hypothetical protein
MFNSRAFKSAFPTLERHDGGAVGQKWALQVALFEKWNDGTSIIKTRTGTGTN